MAFVSSADIERMAKVAEKFPGAFIVFATLKDELSDAEKLSIGELAMQGRATLENGRPRWPVIVLTGTELFASWNLSRAGKTRVDSMLILLSPRVCASTICGSWRN